jgi:hypothetical protein
MIRAAVSLFAVWLFIVGAIAAAQTAAAPWYALGAFVAGLALICYPGGTR